MAPSDVVMLSGDETTPTPAPQKRKASLSAGLNTRAVKTPKTKETKETPSKEGSKGSAKKVSIKAPAIEVGLVQAEGSKKKKRVKVVC